MRRRPPDDGPADDEHQVLLVRRAVAIGAIVLIVILVILGIKGCLGARRDRAMKDYVKDSASLLAESDQGGQAFFKTLRNPGNAGATQMETAINEQRSAAADLVRRAGDLKAPDGMSEAKRYLIETLEFRRDGLTQVSGEISQALGDQQTEQATNQIAADMQNFLASDVIYSQRSYPAMSHTLKAHDLSTTDLPTSHYLPSLNWLDPVYVDSALSGARGASGGPVAPGLHGTGITGVTAQPSGTDLSTDGNNTLSNVSGIAVNVTNQGDNDEKNIVVTLNIEGVGTQQDSIASLAAGEAGSVTIPITREPAKGKQTTMTVVVKAVPGEKKLDNNKQTFTVTFD